MLQSKYDRYHSYLNNAPRKYEVDNLINWVIDQKMESQRSNVFGMLLEVVISPPLVQKYRSLAIVDVPQSVHEVIRNLSFFLQVRIGILFQIHAAAFS